MVPTHVHRQNKALLSYGFAFVYVFIVKSGIGLFTALAGINNDFGLILNKASFVKRMNTFRSEHQIISRTNPKRHGILFGSRFGSKRNSIVVEPSCINITLLIAHNVLPDLT